MSEKNENEPSHVIATRECETEMMTGLSRLFGEAYMRGYAQGRNDSAADSCNRITELEKRLDDAHRREGELHVMLRNFGLPTEPKALARELSGRQEGCQEGVAHEKRIAEPERRTTHASSHSFGHSRPMTLAEEANFSPIQERILSREYHTDGPFPSVDVVIDAAKTAEIRFSWTPDAAFVYDYLRRRLAHPPVDAAGKTPGEFGYSVWYPLCRRGLSMTARDWKTDVSEHDKETWETTCGAVLDAFGNQRAVEVLRRVRLELECRDVVRVDFEHARQLPLWPCSVVESVLSDELAKLRPNNKPAESTSDRLACVGCGGTGVDLYGHTCFECGGTGKIESPNNELAKLA